MREPSGIGSSLSVRRGDGGCSTKQGGILGIIVSAGECSSY